MNPRGILMLVLLIVIGSGRIMCQIVAKDVAKLEIVDVAGVDTSIIKAGMSIQLSIQGILAERNFLVSEEGTVNLPYICKLKAAGRSEAELKADIKKAYVEAGILEVQPISVATGIIGHQKLSQIHIGGQVRKPGPVEFIYWMTVGDAIKGAGGATEFGSLKRVRIIRDGKMATYDLTKKDNLAVPLEVYDTIEIPQKNLFGE